MTGFAAILISGRDWAVPALVAGVVLAATVVWSWRRNSTEPAVRALCTGLKTAGILVLLAALLEPLWLSRKARPGANLFAVVADNSQSMSLKDPGQSESRGGRVRNLFSVGAGGWSGTLEENFQVRRYLFDSRLQNTRDFNDLTFEGRTSALGEAIRTGVEQWRGQPVAGVLLFTDGNATDALDDAVLATAPPLYPVVWGRGADVRDIALRKVGVSQTAFEDAPVAVQAEAEATGFGRRDVVARVTEVAVQSFVKETNRPSAGGYRLTAVSNRVAEVAQRAEGASARVGFRIQLQPAQPGIHFYELDVREGEELARGGAATDEATLVNNSRMLVVDRGQEPFRVLYVSGRPNWEFKFLNRAIQEDRQVQMVSLIRVARREPKFEFKGRAGESSNPLFRGFEQTDEETARYDQPVLIRLNTRDELELRGGFPKTAEELFQYHAILLDDVESEFFTRDQLTLIQRFVSDRGGGFLMLGGAESFREGNYAGTTIASLLPVYADRPADLELPGELRMNLTREGWLQPWMRLRPTESEEASRIETMPSFEVFNAVKDIKPGASVLATVSDANDRTYPALVVQRFGAGRSAAMMVGDLWRWGLRDEAMQRDMSKAWRQLVRWLVADVPARVTVDAEHAEGTDASQVVLKVKVRDPEFKPFENAAVSLNVRPVKLQNRNAPPAPGTATRNAPTNARPGVLLTAESSAREAGTYEAIFVVRDPGAYLAEATVTGTEGQVIGTATTGWASEPDAEEFRSLQPNYDLLEEIARKTGGEVVPWEKLEAFTRTLPERRAPVTETVSSPLWHRPELLLLVIGCFAAEWGIRRWKGLP